MTISAWGGAVVASAGILGLALVGPASAASKPLKKVSIVLDWIGYQPQHFGFHIAKNRGWYADAGLDLTIRGGRGSHNVIHIMAGGGTEFSMVSAATFTQAMGKKGKKGLPLKIVALWGQKDILSAAWFESTGIKSVKDFEGKTIGMVPGSMSHLIWPAFSRAAGIDPAKVKVRHWDWRSYFGIWAAKKVDITSNSALGTSTPHMFKKKHGEIVKQVLYSEYLPILGPSVMVHNDTIAKNPEMVRDFVKVSQRAWQYMIDKPGEAALEAAQIASKKYDKIDPAPVLAEYARLVIPSHMVSASTKGKPVGWMNPADWRKMADLLAKHDKKMVNKLEVGDLMTNRFVE